MIDNGQDQNNRIQELQRLYEQYRGLRALLLTRVSTADQSHEAQERVIREKLINPLGLIVNEESHVIHDTYTGLDYRYRAALDEIIRMAERREFDLLCLDVLDRGLGRKGVSREVFRGQLRDLGIHVLTTEPSDHSDDDSLEGQLMRLLKGYKAEEEINDFVRRSKNGKRHKALGNAENGTPPKVIGNNGRYYGYRYVHDSKGKKETLVPNHDVIFVDRKSIKWTEVRVMIFSFRCAMRRIPLRRICDRLNKIGIPSPAVTLGIKLKSRGVTSNELVWEAASLSRMLRNTLFSGRLRTNTEYVVKVPGMKSKKRIKRPPEEHIIVPIPAIVSVELQEDVLRNLRRNQKFSRRNNKQRVLPLLHGGLAKCGNCGRNTFPRASFWVLKSGERIDRIYYKCMVRANGSFHKCQGCSIDTDIVDNEVWKIALQIIYNPFLVDQALERQRSKDPTTTRRKQITKAIGDLERERKSLQENLMRMIREQILDRSTEGVLSQRLKEIDQLVHDYNSDLSDDIRIQQEWQAAEKELERLHKRCTVMRDKLAKPTYSPTFSEKRDLVEFFGLTATIWEEGHTPHFKISATFSDIVVHLSSRIS